MTSSKYILLVNWGYCPYVFVLLLILSFLLSSKVSKIKFKKKNVFFIRKEKGSFECHVFSCTYILVSLKYFTSIIHLWVYGTSYYNTMLSHFLGFVLVLVLNVVHGLIGMVCNVRIGINDFFRSVRHYHNKQ